MKTHILKFVAILIITLSIQPINKSSYAQAPEKFNYQTVVRDNSGNILANHPVSFRISLLQYSVNGSAVYVEKHYDTTNAYGLSSLKIGGGVPLSGSMAGINWANGPYYIKLELDQNGGSSYVTMGTTQLLSMPYALHSQTADSVLNYPYQVLSISGDTIFLSNGGFVKLPAWSSSNLLPPTVSVQAASGISSSSATLSGIVNANGLFTTVSFEWGLTGIYGNTVTAAQSPVTGADNTPVSAVLSGLQYHTTYHFRIKAANAVNITYSDDMTFTTEITAPSITTNEVTSVLSSSAVCGGNVINDGGSAVTARGVCWSTNPGPTLSNYYTTNGSGTGSFTSNLTGLSLGTTYYVRAYATNALTTAYGNERSFTTVVIPTVTTSACSDIKGISARAGGSMASNGGAAITAYGLCWSTSPNPTTANSTNTSFSDPMTGLSANTVYYVRAYATNVVGTGYGNQISFNSGYVMGANYAGGLVFYNDGAGHGLVCDDAYHFSGQWGCDGTNIPGAEGTAIGTGAQNTIDIEAGCTTPGTAADGCANCTSGGYSDWFLPSKDELNLMYVNLHTQGLGNFGPNTIWSSSECYIGTPNFAWLQDFSDGVQYGCVKYYSKSVRAVRAF
ncbi:MAG TPA: hypothetical protein PKW80_01440 [Bacteroidales bacterium]|nr:hypothetical protein [Bacteroidales bacterium]